MFTGKRDRYEADLERHGCMQTSCCGLNVRNRWKQYKVAEGDVLFVEKLEDNAGDVVTLNEVLACTKDGELVVGAPTVEGASVQAKVVEQGKAKKVIVFKYKAKKDYRRKQGHRQPYTKIVIEKINA